MNKRPCCKMPDSCRLQHLWPFRTNYRFQPKEMLFSLSMILPPAFSTGTRVAMSHTLAALQPISSSLLLHSTHVTWTQVLLYFFFTLPTYVLFFPYCVSVCNANRKRRVLIILLLYVDQQDRLLKESPKHHRYHASLKLGELLPEHTHLTTDMGNYRWDPVILGLEPKFVRAAYDLGGYNVSHMYTLILLCYVDLFEDMSPWDVVARSKHPSMTHLLQFFDPAENVVRRDQAKQTVTDKAMYDKSLKLGRATSPEMRKAVLRHLSVQPEQFPRSSSLSPPPSPRPQSPIPTDPASSIFSSKKSAHPPLSPRTSPSPPPRTSPSTIPSPRPSPSTRQSASAHPSPPDTLKLSTPSVMPAAVSKPVPPHPSKTLTPAPTPTPTLPLLPAAPTVLLGHRLPVSPSSRTPTPTPITSTSSPVVPHPVLQHLQTLDVPTPSTNTLPLPPSTAAQLVPSSDKTKASREFLRHHKLLSKPTESTHQLQTQRPLQQSAVLPDFSFNQASQERFDEDFTPPGSQDQPCDVLDEGSPVLGVVTEKPSPKPTPSRLGTGTAVEASAHDSPKGTGIYNSIRCSYKNSICISKDSKDSVIHHVFCNIQGYQNQHPQELRLLRPRGRGVH